MATPGFTAEAAMGRTLSQYGRPSAGSGRADGVITPAIPISDDEWFQMCRLFGCGAISRPDGTVDCVCTQEA
ncbi:hypothetical protein ACZ90_32900 [Streptomyces albus subsp. albus]|nr:hypothetical protein ACZ90_32900 [Streptomyces albus subsp. albus]